MKTQAPNSDRQTLRHGLTAIYHRDGQRARTKTPDLDALPSTYRVSGAAANLTPEARREYLAWLRSTQAPGGDRGA